MRQVLFALIVCLAPIAGTGVPAGAAEQAQDLLCTKCKAKLKPGATFCTECGTKVAELECAKCKKPMPPGAKFCTNCGQKVEEAPVPKSGERPAPKPEEKSTPKPEEKPNADAGKPAPRVAEPAAKPDRPVGQDSDADQVKQRLDEELRKFGTSSEEVNRAIDRGAAYLAAHYAKRDFTGDEDFLTAYALIHTNQYFSNGKLREKINAFLRSDLWLKGHPVVYHAGLRALALEATCDPALRVLTRECAEYLVESQGAHGTWTYQAKVPITPVASAQKAGDPGLSISGGEPLDEEIKGELVEPKGTCKDAGDGDTSCTQFAILGLHAAAKCGFTVPKAVWERCLKEMEARHCKDGGWHYHGAGPKSYGSMTCAGICTTLLCRYYLGEKDYLEHPMAKEGLKWLADNFSVAENPKDKQWSMYYIYSVERTGVFAATESIGEHRWYGMGAKHLVGTQGKDGSWTGTYENQEQGTAFALLFLTRATSPVRAIRRGGSGWLETHALNDTTNIMFIVDASGSMRDEMDGKEKFQIVKDVVVSIVKKLPEGAHVGLRVYGHRRTALDQDADLDTELLVPVGPLNPATFIARVQSLRCKGMTPLTLSLNETIKDISGVNPDLDLVTILLTDGGETTRGAKPPQAAARLAGARKGMKVHVVGFDINEDDWREQLEKTAEAGNGSYFHARKAADLLYALQLAAVGAAQYTLLNNEGKEVFKGNFGDRHELPEGKYTLVLTLEGKKAEKTVWINTGVVSHATLSLGRILKK